MQDASRENRCNSFSYSANGKRPASEINSGSSKLIPKYFPFIPSNSSSWVNDFVLGVALLIFIGNDCRTSSYKSTTSF